MRIAVSNPDNIGDFVVRQPMLAAFVAAGHEVLLIVRSHVAPLATWAVPGARVLYCAGDPYTPRFSAYNPPDDRLIAALKEFNPDIFVVAAYQHTQLDEQLAGCIPDTQVIGFDGELFQNDRGLGITHVSNIRMAIRVQVGRDWNEARKTELLCSAVLGNAVALPSPTLVAEQRFIDMAAARLRAEGLGERKFWVVCAGEGSNYTRLKNWPLEKWSELCSALVRDHGVRLIFIGTQSEHESTAQIRAGMGEFAQNTIDMTAKPDGLDGLIGLLSLCSGYIGKDTGPMHIAASLGKPVVAVFGGGHWPRFVPSPRIGKVLTMHVPCTDCNWDCPYKISHCVKEVPVDLMLDAVRSVISGKQTAFDTVILEPLPWMARTMALEAAETARVAVHNLTVERSNFHQWHTDRVNDIDGLRRQLEQVESEKSAVAGANQQLTEENRRVQEESARLAAEQQQLRESIEKQQQENDSRQLEIARLTNLASSSSEELEVIRRNVASLQYVADAKAALEQRFSRFKERTSRKQLEGLQQVATLRAQADAAMAESAAAASAHADLRKRLDAAVVESAALIAEKAALSSEREKLEIECAERAGALDVAAAKVDLLESRYQGAIADLRQQLRRAESELHSVLTLVPDLRNELTVSLSEVARMREELGRIPILEEDGRTKQLRVDELIATLDDVESDRARRLELIEASAERILALQQDQADKQELIDASAERILALQQDQSDKQALIDRLDRMLSEVEADRAERLKVIETSARREVDLEADQTAKGELIDRLSNANAALQADHTALKADHAALKADHTALQAEMKERRKEIESLVSRLRQLESDHAESLKLGSELRDQIREIENDRAARLAVIETASKRLKALEADQTAKQALIDKLSSTLAVVEADRAERGKQIDTLNQIAQQYQAEIADLNTKLVPRLAKLVRRG